jgi:hypothetical protein
MEREQEETRLVLKKKNEEDRVEIGMRGRRGDEE